MSFIDARTLPDGHRIESDVCIIGGGATGLALASRFFGRSQRVVILESGGVEFDPATQELYRGPNVGLPHAPLNQCRLRYLGGSTNHWTAHVRPLDPLDFEARPWVPGSGWPFGIEELEPYYSQTREFFQLPERPFDVSAWQRPDRMPWRFEGGRLQNWVRQILPESRRRLASIFRPDLERSANVETVLFANVVRIELNSSRKRVKQLHIRTLSGRDLFARARYVVLATGGIENARVLLLSGIGSDSDPKKDIVGRFYANHPAAPVGFLALTKTNTDQGFYAEWEHATGEARGYLGLSAEAQRKYQLQGCSINLRVPRARDQQSRAVDPASSQRPPVAKTEAALDPLDQHVLRVSSDMDALSSSSGIHGGARVAAANHLVKLRVIAEPSPNAESRVRLGDAVDALGQRRAVLDWRLADRDSHSVRKTMQLAARELGAAGLGRVRIYFEGGFSAVGPNQIAGSHHHMGTTRMQQDPRQGVVDENCRVHGVSNLFVAGSSVFPTYGIPNPTYTIVALSFRLADHLKGLLA